MLHYDSAMVAQPWLLLTYKIPPEPSKKRVAIWRRLKGMGAVYLQSGVCLLPKTDDYVRRLRGRDRQGDRRWPLPLR